MEKNYTQEELETAFRRILKYYKTIYSVSENPKVFLLGGQPGAGKSALEHMINLGKNCVSISGDDYREYHPRFREIHLEYGRDASKYTQQWVSEITEKLIQELRKEKYNLIVEGTLRTYELPLRESDAFEKAAYEGELNILVVKPEKSRLGTLQRYEEMLKRGKTPRATPKEHHELVVNNIGNNLSIVYHAKAFHNIRLFDRENNLLYNQKESPSVNPKEILEKEFAREWKEEEIEEFQKRWEDLMKMMENRKASSKEITLLEEEKKSTLERIWKLSTGSR